MPLPKYHLRPLTQGIRHLSQSTFTVLYMKKNPKNNADDEFDLFFQKFLDEALDDETLDDDDDDGDHETVEPEASDDHEESDSSLLPFPPEMDSRVAAVRMKTNLEERHDMEDVQSVSIEVMPDQGKRLCCDGKYEV